MPLTFFFVFSSLLQQAFDAKRADPVKWRYPLQGMATHGEEDPSSRLLCRILQTKITPPTVTDKKEKKKTQSKWQLARLAELVKEQGAGGFRALQHTTESVFLRARAVIGKPSKKINGALKRVRVNESNNNKRGAK